MFIHLSKYDLPDLKSHTTSSGKRHYVTPNGNKYPSITTMLGAKEKPWLEDWKKSLGEAFAKKETKRCSDRGTAVHLLAEKYLNNEEYPKLLNGSDTRIQSDFKKLRLSLNKINNIYGQEIALYSDTLRLAGRVDCIGEYNGVPSIIDFKTSTANKTRAMIQDYFLQCTAYSIMWEELTGDAIENIVILMTVENGAVPLVFKEKIDKYIEPLIRRISEYNRARR